MEYISMLNDDRINSVNYSFEITISSYLELVKPIIESNVFQRRRVRGSGTIYSLLKEDLKRGCIIPPIVLALSDDASVGELREAKLTYDKLISLLKDNIPKLLILDGLQRTYSILDLVQELKERDDQLTLEKVNGHKIRIELYVGINRLGILYRMLTLNTGQTPMSLRHQIEILYYDYLEQGFEGIELIREADQSRATRTNEYNFRDIIEGFNSYLERNELPIDKFNLLENIKGLEKLAQENQEKDLFKLFLRSFHSFIIKLNEISEAWQYKEGEVDLSGQPFGNTPESVFKKSQVLTGYGAAIGRLKDFNILGGFEDVVEIVKEIRFEGNPDDAYRDLLSKLEIIRNQAKKIGNAQRMFFQYFFRELFNNETDSFPYIDRAIGNSYQKYVSQTM